MFPWVPDALCLSHHGLPCRWAQTTADVIECTFVNIYPHKEPMKRREVQPTVMLTELQIWVWCFCLRVLCESSIQIFHKQTYLLFSACKVLFQSSSVFWNIRGDYFCILNFCNNQNMILYFTLLLLSDFTCQETPEGNKNINYTSCEWLYEHMISGCAVIVRVAIRAHLCMYSTSH